MNTVAVVDYGMSNLRSVSKALEHLATDSQRITVTSDPDVVIRAERVVFPGQGAIGHCMESLKQTGLDEALAETMRDRPFLGICLGLQTLLDRSEEDGGTAGFGAIAGNVIRFSPDSKNSDGDRLKIPHMGWNQVQQPHAHPLWNGIEDNAWFYFVHSYHAEPASQDDVTGQTNYGIPFCSAAGRDNLFAVQFHPEKSQHAGLKLLENFLRWE